MLVIGHKTILANILNLFPRFDATDCQPEKEVCRQVRQRRKFAKYSCYRKKVGLWTTIGQLKMTEKLTQTAISVEDTEDRFFTMLMN